MLRMLVAAAFVTLAACSLSIPIGGPITGHQIVESNADARRVLFELRKRRPLVIAKAVSRLDELHDAPGTTYTVGREWVHLHSYSSVDAAAAARARLVQHMRTTPLQWVGQPHAFHCRSVVALYLGSDPGSIAALGRFCGAPMRP